MQMFSIALVGEQGPDWGSARIFVRPDLTEMQRKIIRFIREYQQMWGSSPLYRETGRACGLHRETSVCYQISRLVKLGLLRKPPRLHRALRVTVMQPRGSAT